LALQGINLKKSHQSQSQEEDNEQKKKEMVSREVGGDALNKNIGYVTI